MLLSLCYYILKNQQRSLLTLKQEQLIMRYPGVITLRWVKTPSTNVKCNYEGIRETAPTGSAP